MLATYLCKHVYGHFTVLYVVLSSALDHACSKHFVDADFLTNATAFSLTIVNRVCFFFNNLSSFNDIGSNV